MEVACSWNVSTVTPSKSACKQVRVDLYHAMTDYQMHLKIQAAIGAIWIFCLWRLAFWLKPNTLCYISCVTRPHWLNVCVAVFIDLVLTVTVLLCLCASRRFTRNRFQWTKRSLHNTCGALNAWLPSMKSQIAVLELRFKNACYTAIFCENNTRFDIHE